MTSPAKVKFLKTVYRLLAGLTNAFKDYIREEYGLKPD